MTRVSDSLEKNRSMAASRTFICDACGHSIEVWDDGNPYFIDAGGVRRYAYHPDPLRDRCTGVEWPAVCLQCGADVVQDSAAPLERCPRCDALALTDATALLGCQCPYCCRGVFRQGPPGLMKIS